MLVVSPTRYVPASAYAHAGPIAPAPAPLRTSRAVASRPLRAGLTPSLHVLHYAQGVRAHGAHLYFPHAPQKSRHAALFDYAQSAAWHAFCGDGACPVELATLGGQPLRGFRGSTAGNPPTQAALQAALTPADVLRLKQKGMLCVRSPKTAHTRRPARRITCPSVPPAARGSAPAAAQEAAGRRKTWPLRVHARRSRFNSHPLRLLPLAGAGALVAPSRASLQAALLRRSEERRLSRRASGSRYSPESRLHNSPDHFAAACR
jgi:hypothetical protein